MEYEYKVILHEITCEVGEVINPKTVKVGYCECDEDELERVAADIVHIAAVVDRIRCAGCKYNWEVNFYEQDPEEEEGEDAYKATPCKSFEIEQKGILLPSPASRWKVGAAEEYRVMANDINYAVDDVMYRLSNLRDRMETTNDPVKHEQDKAKTIENMRRALQNALDLLK